MSSTTRALAEWIERDYFRRERGFRRLKRRLIWAALLLSLLVVTAPAVFPRGRQIYQAGPVSAGHATFADRCETCHTQPFRTAGRFLGDGTVSSVSDGACRHCHGEHPHHATEEARPANCAACHREHRGHPNLSQVPDGRCTSCHEDLRNAVKPGVAVQFENVPDLAGHPDFALWRRPGGAADPGRLNFSHQAHLVELVMHGPDPDGPLVSRKLSCGDCHQTDAGGLLMQPIRYQKHCAECHPLLPQLADEGRDDVTRKAVTEFRRTPVPHPGTGQSAETARGVLRDRLTRLAQEHPALIKGEADEPPRPIPGASRTPPASREVFEWVNQRLNESERPLFDKKAGCLLCHQESGEPGRRPGGLPTLAPTGVSERWFSHAVFSHRSHRAQDCLECHKGVADSREARDVLLPRLDDCRRCHYPSSPVRSDCVTCHDYHTFSRRPRGGAEERRPEGGG